MKGKQNKKMAGKAKRQITGDWSQKSTLSTLGTEKRGTKKEQGGTKCRNKKKAVWNKM